MNFFKKEKNVHMKAEHETVQIPSYDSNNIRVDFIYSNQYPRIISRACAVCWDKVPPNNTEDQITYISKRIKTGHTSILEHSNIVMLAQAKLNEVVLKRFLEFTADCKYLNTKIKFYGNTVYLLIGGSLRGYFDVFNRRITKNRKEYVIEGIINEFYKFSYKELFKNYIDAGIIPDVFESYEFVDNAQEQLRGERGNIVESETRSIYVENYDDIHVIHDNIRKLTKGDIFDFDDLLEYTSITVLFKNMSRTATHQLVRHRNAITQESQRYVDYSNANFVSPGNYNQKIKDHQYDIDIFGTKVSCTLDELGNELCHIYGELIDGNDEYNLRREEARAFLPSNVACNKLYMTFNLLTLFKFFQLRIDKAAQAEIREYASMLLDEYTLYVHSLEAQDLHAIPYDTKYLIPKYIRDQIASYDDVDEMVGE